MAYYRLKENHPAHQALNRVFQYMEENGLEIEVGGWGSRIYINYQGKRYQMLDIETPPESDMAHPNCFPYNMEYKLVYEKTTEEEANSLQIK